MGRICIGDMCVDEIINEINKDQQKIKNRLSETETTADTLKSDIKKEQNKKFIKDLYLYAIYKQLLNGGNNTLKCLCEEVRDISSSNELSTDCYNSAILCLYNYRVCIILLFQMILLYMNVCDEEKLIDQQKELLLEEHDLSVDNIEQCLIIIEQNGHNEAAKSILQTLMRHGKSLIELNEHYSEIFDSNNPFILCDKDIDVNTIVLDGRLDDNNPHYLRLDKQKIELATLNNFRRNFIEIISDIENSIE